MWIERRPARTVPAHEEGRYERNGEVYEPELTRRVAAATAPSIDPSQEAFCLVSAATVTDDGGGAVHCSGAGGVAAFDILLPNEAVSDTGALHDVGVGDLVRVHGHGLIRMVFGTRDSHWRFESVPPDGVSIVARSTCCSAPAPTTAASDPAASL